MPTTILLLQARQRDDGARHDERRSFARAAGVPPANVIPFDLLSRAPTMADVRQFDIVMIGGSGDFYVSKGNLPHFAETLAALRGIVEDGFPMFASCFGFQLLVHALGGSVVYDPDHLEAGTYTLTLTDAGRSDDLLQILPPVFQAQEGHKDRAERLPAGLTNLAASANAPLQAFRIPGKPIWATQFHAELTGAENLARFKRYIEGYGQTMTPAELQRKLDSFQASPETDRLIGRFIELVRGSD